MSLVAIEGFELQGGLFAGAYSTYFGPADPAFTFPGRDGGLANDIADMTCYRDVISAAATGWVFGVSLYSAPGKPDGSCWVGLGLGTSMSFVLEVFKQGTSVIGRLRIGDVTGNLIQISPGVSTFALGSTAEWIQLEIKVILNAVASGSVEIRKNGTTSPSLLTLTNIQTTTANNSTGARSIAFHTGPSFAFDDMWFITTDATTPNDWIGAGKKIVSLAPVAQAATAYTPVGAANNLAAVTDLNDATAVESNTINNEDRYTIQPISALGATTVFGVQLHVRASVKEVSSRNMRVLMRESANTAETDPIPVVGRNKRTLVQTRGKRPNGTDWTTGALDALEIGFKTAN